jgi:PAS domain
MAICAHTRVAAMGRSVLARSDESNSSPVSRMTTKVFGSSAICFESRLRLKIDAPQLEEMMLEVIHEVQLRQAQVQDHEGKWLVLRITPYRTLDNRIDGVVLTVLDRNAFEELSGNKPARSRETRTKRNHVRQKR